MTLQNPVSLQIPIKPDKVKAITRLLNTGGNPQIEEKFFALDKIPTVHFARWIVIPAKDDIPPSLFYAANIDGDIATHITDLATTLTKDLDRILSHCVAYPEGSALTKDARVSYLKNHMLPTQGFYTGAPNRTVEQIKHETSLYNAIRNFVKENGKQWTSNKQAYEAIKKHLAGNPQWDWARKKYHLPKIRYLKMALILLLLIAMLPLLIIFILIIHFFYEPREKPFGKSKNQIPAKHLQKLKDEEDIIYQNQLSQVFEMKSGLRKLQLRFFLWVTSYGARNFFVRGELLGTPTIHFARWVIIDKGKRFIFFSNFDGSFDEYLGDFVDNSGWGLNAIYSASVGYPRTFFMLGKGAYNIIEFMGWGRITQVPTPLWYSAYPWVGLQQIVSRSKLRTELFNSGDLNDDQIKKMLRRI